MDSTAAEDARDAKRARITPSAGDDTADLISGLDDDVLLRVLGLVPDARDAVRTGALSRRWLRLWTRVPALRFASLPQFAAIGGGAEQRAALERYAAFVDGVLAQRARSSSAIESLSIVYTPGSDVDNLERPMPPSSADAAQLVMFPCLPDSEAAEHELQQLMLASANAAQGWIGCAFKHGVRSFNLDLNLPLVAPNIWRESYDDYMDELGGEKGNGRKKPVVLLDELPNPVMLETMRLALGGSRLRLPTAMRFASLMDVSLERIRIAAGSAHLLGRLVSSESCPRLQKLHMSKIYLQGFYEEMRVEADMLSELQMEDVKVLRSLKLRTPRLKVLHIYKCSNAVLRVSAPRLEELTLSFQLGYPPWWLEIDGYLPCVQSLKISLWSHRSCVTSHREAENNSNILILKKCSSLACLDVTLYAQEAFEEDVELIKSRVPQLPHITSLTVNVSNWFERHEFGAGVASLLTRFCNLRHLSLHLPIFLSLECNLHEESDLLCDHPDHWESNEISMAYLEELEATGFTGTDCELWFIKAVLTSAKSVQKVAISFNADCLQHKGKMDAFEQMLLGGGIMWTSYRDTHNLTCLAC